MGKIFWLAAFGVGFVLSLSGSDARAQVALVCSGAQVARGAQAPEIYMRLDISVTDKEIKKRWLGVSRFKDSFRDPKPEDILDTVTRRGQIKLIPCDDDGWPSRCTSQQPAIRNLLVSQFAEDPLYLMGYMTCAFCQLSPMIVETMDDDSLEFRYFENDMVVGTCREQK